MPDVWEKVHGLNPKDASDGPKISLTGILILKIILMVRKVLKC